MEHTNIVMTSHAPIQERSEVDFEALPDKVTIGSKDTHENLYQSQAYILCHALDYDSRGHGRCIASHQQCLLAIRTKKDIPATRDVKVPNFIEETIFCIGFIPLKLHIEHVEVCTWFEVVKSLARDVALRSWIIQVHVRNIPLKSRNVSWHSRTAVIMLLKTSERRLIYSRRMLSR